jgi:large-conductance mechanosensitive channel
MVWQEKKICYNKINTMAFGNMVLAVINFLIYPTWHLVVLYVVLLLIVVWSMLKSWGF